MQALTVRRRRPPRLAPAAPRRRQLADHDGAGAAVAFVAAFLGAGAVRVLAQPVEHGARRGDAVDLDDGAAVEEADRLRSSSRCCRRGCRDRVYTHALRALTPRADEAPAITSTATLSAALIQADDGTRNRLALRGDLLDFTADAGLGRRRFAAVRFRPDHWLLIEGGRIVGACQARRRPMRAGSSTTIAAGCCCPGFIDTHVHSPQLDVIASYGTELLDWLDDATPFRPRRAMPIPAQAEAGAERFLDALLAHGTTARWSFRPCTRSAWTRCSPRREARGMRLHHRQGADGPATRPTALRDDVDAGGARMHRR